MLTDKDLLSIQQARQLVERAHRSAERFRTYSQDQVDAVVAAMARAAEVEARPLAQMAVEETGYGRVDHKTVKNLFSAVDVYNYIKGLKTCGVIGENEEKKVIDIAVPVGVIAAVIPTTNPTSTTIFKILCAVKGRNPIVISPHPHAIRCICETARIMYEAGLKAGAPQDCVTCLEAVAIEGTTELMRHPRTALILATGGAGLVRAAYSSGKPAFGVGPGNVPAYIERTADVPKAVRDVIAGKTFDWGVLCSSEQSLVCDRAIESEVLGELEKNGACLLSPDEQAQLERVVQLPNKSLNTAIVGKPPQVIASLAGFSVGSHVTCLVGRPRGVGRDHPLSMEKLSPILGFYVAEDWREGCELCIRILSFGGLGHTMAIHSRDRDVIMEFGLHKPAYRICVNTPATHGSVGLTTGVPPSMTLGCGTPGGNITSDNITPMHLINIKRLAFETRPVDSLPYGAQEGGVSGKTASATVGLAPSAVPSRFSDPDRVREAVRLTVSEYFEQKKNLDTPPRVPPPPRSAAPARPQAPRPPAVDFVCEDDVRQALRHKQKIVIHARTLLTPSARDLGETHGVFLWDENPR